VANTITFKVKVEKDGNLSVIAKQAEKAAKSTGKLGTETDKTTKARNRFNKAEKGVGQAGLSSGKAFSKMNQTMGGGGGLVAAYAVLAANIFALTAAFGALSRAAQVEKLKEGMVAMGQSTGVAMNALSENLVKATGHAISLEEAMRTTAQVTSAGFDPSVIERLGSVARMASQALGRDLGDAMQRITKGAIKMEPELLDELGIMVRLDDATASYAASIGKSADDLTKFEKQQAFMNAVLEEGEAKFSALGEVDVNPYTVLAATFANLTTTMLNFINGALTPIVKLLGGSGTLLVGAMLIFASTIGKIVQPALVAFTARLGASAKAAADSAKATLLLTGTTGKGSAKVMDLKNALAKGTATTTQWKSGLDGAVKSVRGYETALAKSIKSTGHFSKKTIESQRALKQARKDHIDLVKAKMQLDIANIKNSSTNAMNTLQTHGLRAGVKVLGKEMSMLYMKTFQASAGLGFMSRAMAVASGAAKAASAGFAFLGAAIMAAMNVIGIVVMVLYALYEAAKWLIEYNKSPEENALTATAESAATALKDTQDNLKELDASYDGQKTKIVGITGQYKSLSNILATTGQVYNKLAASQAALDKSEGKGKDEAQGQSELVKHMLALASSSKVMQKTLADAGISMEALKDGTITLEQLETGMAQVEKTNKQVNVRFVAMAHAIKGMNEPLQEFLNKMKETTTVDEVASSFEDMAKTLEDDKFSTPMDKLQGLLENADDAMLKLLGTSKLEIEAAAKVGFGRQVLAMSVLKQFTAVKGIFDTEKRSQILHKQKLKFIKLEISVLKSRQGIEGQAAALFDKEAESRSEIATRMQEEITLQETTNKGAKKGSDIHQFILGLKEELAVFNKLAPTLEQKSLDIAKEKMVILKREQSAQKEVLAIMDKMGAAQSKLLDLQDASNRNSMMMTNLKNKKRGFSASLNASDERKAQLAPTKIAMVDENGKSGEEVTKTMMEARKIAATNEYNLTILKLGMEADMNTARLNIIKHELSNIHAKSELIKLEAFLKANPTKTDADFKSTEFNSDVIDNAISLSGREGPLHIMQKKVALATKDGVIDGIDLAAEQTKRDVISEVVGAKGATTGERLSNMNEAGGLDAEGMKGSDKFAAIGNAFGPMMDKMKSLGPAGELVSAAAQGAIVVAESWANVGEVFTGIDATTGKAFTSMEKGIAVGQAISAGISQVSSIMAASSKNRIAGIDSEIEAEKKRDGKSKESVAKIKALEKKKEGEKRKAFEVQKKMQMAQIIASTAVAIMQTMATGGAYALPIALMVGAMGAAQLAVVAGTSYQGGGSASSAAGPTGVSVGKRKEGSDLSKSKSARGELSYFRGESGTGGAENFRSAFYGKKHRASGGNTGYVVGEQGPELFMPDRPGTIVPADEVAGAGASSNVTFSINAIDATGVEDVLIQQQGNIIGMLRSAANSYGEDFMEDLDESTYTTPVARRA